MFHKKTFMFFGFDETHEKEMEKFLLEKGGKREEISCNVCKFGVVFDKCFFWTFVFDHSDDFEDDKSWHPWLWSGTHRRVSCGPHSKWDRHQCLGGKDVLLVKKTTLQQKGSELLLPCWFIWGSGEHWILAGFCCWLNPYYIFFSILIIIKIWIVVNMILHFICWRVLWIHTTYIIQLMKL